MPTQPGCWTMQSGIPFNMAQTWWMEVGFKFGWQKSNENSPSPRQSLVASTWLVNCTRSSGEFSATANTEGEELEVSKAWMVQTKKRTSHILCPLVLGGLHYNNRGNLYGDIPILSWHLIPTHLWLSVITRFF